VALPTATTLTVRSLLLGTGPRFAGDAWALRGEQTPSELTDGRAPVEGVEVDGAVVRRASAVDGRDMVRPSDP
jgi:hypothetical protein